MRQLIANLMQDSGMVEWYTPEYVLDIAREVMGGIDFDPASNEKANRLVGATKYIGTPPVIEMVADHNGLPVYKYVERGNHQRMPYGAKFLTPRQSRVWMNHPFGRTERGCDLTGCTIKRCRDRGYHFLDDRAGNAEWIEAMVTLYRHKHIPVLMGICFSAVNANWFAPLRQNAALGVFDHRVNYERINADGQREKVTGATKDSVMYYLGPDRARFKAVFEGGGHGEVLARI